MNCKRLAYGIAITLVAASVMSPSVFAARSVVLNAKTEENEKTTEVSTEQTTEVKETATVSETSTETTTEAAAYSLGNVITGKELRVYDVVNGVANFTPNSFSPSQRVNYTETEDAVISLKEYLFENGDYYWFKRMEYKKDSELPYTTAFNIPGNSIQIRYVVPGEKRWENTSQIDNVPQTMLFIDTDQTHMVISVPAVYRNSFEANTLEILRSVEKPLKIEKLDGEYKITAEFYQNTDAIGELWVLKSSYPLADWSKKETFDDLLNHDLAVERRWSWDGYYYAIPYNYVPNGENYLYRNVANYTGSSWAKTADNLLKKDLGYVMCETCIKNQISDGYWTTGPKSLWLEEDFGIGGGFYDTRFNTDFAVSLLGAYQNYGNKDFLESAVKYGEFFLEHAEKNHYDADGGWLVEDYAGGDVYTRTHVSLNHQLAELNFLYELHNITGEQRYKDTADKMLLGIENTRDKWVREDNNLEYAIMYNGSANVMVDYPFLTYNDLYKTNHILRTYYNTSSDAVIYLMACKKQWMINNNVTGYYGEFE